MKRDTMTSNIKTVTRFEGVRATARQIGCTPGHLSLVLHGKRPAGRKMAAKLRRLHVKLPKIESV